MKKLALLLLATLLVAGCRDVTPITTPGEINREILLSEHNRHRSKWPAKPPLSTDYGLEQFAQNHAEWMAGRGRLRHSDLDMPGSWRMRGENIAYGQSDEVEVTDAWMNSSGHRANILNKKFTHVGFGFAKAKDGRIYWCAVFAG